MLTVADRDMAVIAQCDELQRLYLSYTGVTDTGLAELGGLPLRRLEIAGTSTTDMCLEDAPWLKRLTNGDRSSY